MNPLRQALAAIFGVVTTAPSGQPLPMPLAMRDDVGNHALRFEAPVMRAGAAEAGLHFVRDADAARGAHVFVGVLEIAVGKNDAAADALDRFRDEARDLSRAWRSRSGSSHRPRISVRRPDRRGRTAPRYGSGAMA